MLKPTGSIYFHCDSTMSHAIKMLLDGIWGRSNFRNEITWQRRYGAFSTLHKSKKFGVMTDAIFFYAKTEAAEFRPQYSMDDPQYLNYVNRTFRHVDENGRRYRIADLANPALRPNLIYEYKGYPPPKNGWAISREKMEQWDTEGRLHFPSSPTGRIQRRRFLDELKGKPVQNLWTDIKMVSSQSAERLGYPTQKPVALLERILRASSNEGDTVLDPFCGCGTTIHAAQNLNRRWIGIDICVNACKVIEERLRGHFDSLWSEVEFHGLPKTLDDARFMAGGDPFRFERWAASLVDGMEANSKQRGDKGIDGWGRIPIRKGQFVDMVSQVKGGSTGPGHVQAFNGARQQAGADLGIFTCFEDRVTTNMRNAAVGAGLFMERTPVVQIYTVEDYFEGRKPALPVAA